MLKTTQGVLEKLHSYIYRSRRQNLEGRYLRNYIRNFRKLRILGISSSLVLVLLMILAAFPIVNNIGLVEAAPGTAVPSQTVLTMTSGNENAGIDLVVRDNNGTFASSSDSSMAKFGIVTDNNTGYTLSIVGANDNGQLTNSTSGTVLDSIPSSIDANTFNSSNSYNGKWGYSPSKYNSAANTDFLPSPTTTASTLDVTSVANAATANNYTISLGARADYSLPSGVYTNTFTLAVVGNPVAYTISYDKGNTTDTVTNLPTSQSSSTTETSVTLSDTVPVRSGYDFIGWCNGTVTTDEDETDTCSNNTIYNPNGDGTNLTFGIDQTTANVVTLHAMWQKVKSMQVWTGCSAMSSGDKIALTDARDGQEYDVTKIGDYCIMTENLAISGTIPAEGSNFTGADITPDYTDYGWFTSTYLGDKVMYKDDTLGGYYNYCLASAGTICSNVQQDATQDICPANWKMPTTTTWNNLKAISGSGALFARQPSGYYTNSASPSSTSYGYYWSSNAYNTNYPYYLYASASSLNNPSSNYRYYGLSIRCVYNPSVTVQVNKGTGISSVNINGGTSGSTATYTGHMEDQITINAATVAGYGPAYTWTKDSGTGSFTAASTNTESNTFTLGPADTSLSVSATSGVAVIIKVNDAAGPGISLNGTSCTTTAGCLVTGLTPGSSYDLVANITAGSSFSSWSSTAGAIASTSSASTRYTVPSSGSGVVATVTLNITRNKYNITIKRVTGLSKVSLNGTECTSTSGCTVSDLTYGQAYTITATKSSGYDFASWDPGSYGSVASASSASTSYTVGAGNSTITPSVTSCTQTISGTMQNYTPPDGLCSDAYGSLTDNRDNQTYTVAKINGRFWMTRNLAIGCYGSGQSYSSSRRSVTLTTDNSNLKEDWSTSSALGLVGETPTSYYGVPEPRMQCDSTYGAWYNFGATVANQYEKYGSGGHVRYTFSYSICPKGWVLPTKSEFESINPYPAIYKPTLGGIIRQTRYDQPYTINDTSAGTYYSKTASGSATCMYMQVNSDGNLWMNYECATGMGRYVRCVKAN